jgi:hypothetical protein
MGYFGYQEFSGQPENMEPASGMIFVSLHAFLHPKFRNGGKTSRALRTTADDLTVTPIFTQAPNLMSATRTEKLRLWP